MAVRFSMRAATQILISASIFFGVVLISDLTPYAVGQAVPPAVPQPASRPLVKVDMVIRWNRILLQAVRRERTPPPLAVRNMAIVHAAVYDAVNSIVPTHRHYLVQVQALPGTLPEAAAAAAAYRCLVRIYPRQKPVFDREFAACLAELPQHAGKDRGISLGHFVAKQFMAWRKDDGGNQQVQLKKGPGFWEPTPPAFDAPLMPSWGSAKLFAVKRPLSLPAGPPSLTSAAYTRAFEEVRALGTQTGSARSAEQTEIARFWEDGAGTSTPPGHWNEIAQTVALARGNTLADNARLFALLNISMADAGILCWFCKFTFDFWRPATAIRQAGNDGNPQTAADPTWTPLLVTPPFPAYTSGHSSFSSAAATVLADFCGTDKFAFQSTGAGTTRAFTSFWQAAEEAGRSRIYGGIHWNFDNSDGLASGKSVGAFVVRSYMGPVERVSARTKQ